MTIYSKTGDSGRTRIAGGPLVPKDDIRLEVLGSVDELSAALGLARAEPLRDDIGQLVWRVQTELSAIMAELGTINPAAHGIRPLDPGGVHTLENAIDSLEAALPPLKGFILPGGARAEAALHLARTICRRAERRLTTLARLDESAVSENITAYFNRLGDLLFVLARACAGT